MVRHWTGWWVFLILFLSVPGQSQDAGGGPGATAPASLEVEPTELTLEVGEKHKLVAVVRDAAGEVMDQRVVFFSRARQSVGVNAEGEVEAYRAGEHKIVALVPRDADAPPQYARSLLRVEVSVTIPAPPVASVSFDGVPDRLYAGTEIPVTPRVTDASGERRLDVAVKLTTEDPDIATISALGELSLHKEGKTTLTARAESTSTSFDLEVLPNPIHSFELRIRTLRGHRVAEGEELEVATGDVVGFEAVARDQAGRKVKGLVVRYAANAWPSPKIIAPGATAQVDPDGRFVAERSGIYTVLATVGSASATRSLEVKPRDVRREVEVVGHGAVRDRHTSDLWVWEGVDGNDYAITGTWGAGGHAYIWDVTRPEAIALVDTAKVDARTVNDVKVSADGRYAVLSREGASNRKNGIVILDVSEPRVGVRIIGNFDDQLHGGVHNVFIHDSHVYTLNNGRRLDVVSIRDPTEPYRVGRFELETPGHSIHDVWVVDGIAYTSNWRDGVAVVDVGGGGHGGSPKRPVKLGSYSYPNGWNHAAFPYRSPSTGKFYVFAGDEAFPYGRFHSEAGSVPNRAAGWIHVIEWEDWEQPREVARYQVPEAGTHNFWIEDDILYIGYYNGGLRAVDVSGELRGNLYRQGREIAFWMPYDPKGYVANAPFTWGPQPFKGHVFLADWNSGLWALKLLPKDGPSKTIGEPQ